MKVEDIIQEESSREEAHIINERCSEFLTESGGLPLMRNLPSEYGDFHKVKVRQRRNPNTDTERLREAFNTAFVDVHPNLRERAVFAKGMVTESNDPNLEPFYIFPIDGYKFLYSREVSNSSQDYQHVVEAVFNEFGIDEGTRLITELLKFSYHSENLFEGINTGAEIIVYNIPYFYAIRASTVNDYNELLTSIQDTT